MFAGKALSEAVAGESCPLFRVLRHRTPNSPICLSEVIRKPFALSRVSLLSSGGKSVLLVKKKAPFRSGILLSTHVVLKTRHVNPNIHVRRFIVHARSPNLSATRPQLLYLRGATTQYRSAERPVLVDALTTIGYYYEPIVVDSRTTIGRLVNHYWLAPHTNSRPSVDEYWFRPPPYSTSSARCYKYPPRLSL